MLYYTGAAKPEEIQDNPSISLGGFKSSSQIPNGQIHNLFPKITQSVVMNNRKITRMIVFHNQLPVDMSNINLFIDNSDKCKFTLCVIAPGYDAQCDRFFFEQITDERNLPYQGVLEQHDETNPISIPTLQAGKFIGIWIRRELDLSAFNDVDKGQDIELPCEQMIELLQQQQTAIVEDQMKLHIEWD